MNSRHQPDGRPDPTAVMPMARPIQPQNLLYLPYPEFGSVTENYSPIGSAPYNALQVQVTKPMKHQLHHRRQSDLG